MIISFKRKFSKLEHNNTLQHSNNTLYQHQFTSSINTYMYKSVAYFMVEGNLPWPLSVLTNFYKSGLICCFH